jgi:uncharacterized protein YqjF (DUF2071 family)
VTYDEALQDVEHRPYPLPAGMWRMRQRWRDLLFAHWPIPVDAMARLIPAGLEVDAYDGSAWAGVVPFWMDEVQVRAAGQHTITFPSVREFPELNLRTYVRSRRTGRAGVYFFSLDCSSWLAVLGARTLFHLPYFPAAMRRETSGARVEYSSRRLLTRQSVRFEASYRTLGEPIAHEQGSIEAFLTERYCLFTESRGRLLVGDIHHVQWPLERAEAEIRVDEIPAVHGLMLPERAPLLHFSRELRVAIWALREDR